MYISGCLFHYSGILVSTSSPETPTVAWIETLKGSEKKKQALKGGSEKHNSDKISHWFIFKNHFWHLGHNWRREVAWQHLQGGA